MTKKNINLGNVSKSTENGLYAFYVYKECPEQGSQGTGQKHGEDNYFLTMLLH
jgi:hypothetical protein